MEQWKWEDYDYDAVNETTTSIHLPLHANFNFYEDVHANANANANVYTDADVSQLRFLAGEKVVIDYSVFGMTMVTLVFIFAVGIVRHKVEHMVKARGSEVFELVLETCYHECKFK